MYDIYVEQKLIMAYNDAVNWNQVFNKVKPNIKDLNYEIH